jgi:hypothetical protein
MSLSTFFALVLTLNTLGFVALGQGKESVNIEKVAAFKRAVDFDKAFRAEGQFPPLRLLIPDILSAPGLKNGAWQLSHSKSQQTPTGLLAEWILNSGSTELTIKIFTSSEGVQPARDFLLSGATENNRVASPFLKHKSPIGSLAVGIVVSDVTMDLIWVYRNIGTQIRSSDTKFDVSEMAQWLQGAPKADLNWNMSSSDSLKVPKISQAEAIELATKKGLAATWKSAEFKKGHWHITGVSKSLVPPQYYVISATDGRLLYENKNTGLYPLPTWD